MKGEGMRRKSRIRILVLLLTLGVLVVFIYPTYKDNEHAVSVYEWAKERMQAVAEPPYGFSNSDAYAISSRPCRSASTG